MMFGAPDPTVGRGIILFAILMLGLSLFAGFGRQSWRDAILWLSIAIFMVCYGLIMLNKLPHLHRLLLIVGLASGVVGFGLAVASMLGA